MSDKYGGSDDPCILGYTNGTYPNGTLGDGNWKRLGIYVPSAREKALCQAPNDPWIKSFRYAWWTHYFILAIFATLAICNAIRRLHALNRVTGVPSVISFPPRLSAYARMLSYPQSVRLRGLIPAAGPSFLIFSFALFTNLMCFIPRPYYRPPNYGTSVLGLRAEWIATAMVPWFYALGARRNFITYLSGVSAQRVMTIHKYAPWICLYFAIIHAWTNIIRAGRQEPWSYTWKNNALYRNGFPPLVALTWLCVMSLRPIRARFYETFYVFHIIAAAMTATVIIWGASIVWRILAILLNHGLILKGFPRARIELLPGGMYSIRILVPPSYRWAPGSHIYIRFLTVRPWQTHPFSIGSIPRHTVYSFHTSSGIGAEKHELSDSSLEHQKEIATPEGNELMFLIKPQTGLTKRLYQLAQRGATSLRLPCMLDGPYAGFVDGVRACDALVLIAGGSGMSAMVPLALDVQGRVKVEIHWSVRCRAAPEEWFDQGWMDAANVQIYVTDPGDGIQPELTQQSASDSGRQEDQIAPTAPSPDHTEKLTHPARYLVNAGRPDLNRIVEDCLDRYEGRIGVVVCGPESMTLEVRNAVAHAQKRLVKGDGTCRALELELYEESFSM